MQPALEIAKYILPSLVVFFTAWVLIRGFLVRDEKRLEQELALANEKTILPLRLQAYERVALLLERISPESLVMRVNKPGMTAHQLHSELLASIRAEFEHNLSQQIYMSSGAWQQVRTAKSNVINMVNAAADLVRKDATAITLSQKIFEQLLQLNNPPVEEALEFIKKEIRELY